METFLSQGLAEDIASLASRPDGSRDLVMLGVSSEVSGMHKVSLKDVDRHFKLLDVLVRAAHITKTKKVFWDGYMAINSAHEDRLSGKVNPHAWSEYEADKTVLLWQYTYRFLNRSSFTRSVSIARLRSVFVPTRSKPTARTTTASSSD
eukprot:4939405-Alexandrium_andersonii.AAC.1